MPVSVCKSLLYLIICKKKKTLETLTFGQPRVSNLLILICQSISSLHIEYLRIFPVWVEHYSGSLVMKSSARCRVSYVWAWSLVWPGRCDLLAAPVQLTVPGDQILSRSSVPASTLRWDHNFTTQTRPALILVIILTIITTILTTLITTTITTTITTNMLSIIVTILTFVLSKPSETSTFKEDSFQVRKGTWSLFSLGCCT